MNKTTFKYNKDAANMQLNTLFEEGVEWVNGDGDDCGSGIGFGDDVMSSR